MDYSKISDKDILQQQIERGIELKNVEFLEFFTVKNRVTLINPSEMFILQSKKNAKKKNTKYFYSENDTKDSTIQIKPYSKKTKSFHTTKDRHLLKHFGRPLSEVCVNILERTVSIENDIVSVRYYHFSKFRGVNCKFFKKFSDSYGIKINLKTGNIIAYDVQKGMPNKIRQNYFVFINEISNKFFNQNTQLVRNADDHIINKEFLNNFDDDEFFNTIKHAILSVMPAPSSNFKSLYDNKRKHSIKLQSLLMEVFVEKNGIKTPNTYLNLMLNWYPGKPFLKKNSNKLVAAILDRLKLKSKGLIKLIHQYPNLDIGMLILLAKYFGYNNLSKYLPNINKKIFLLKYRIGETEQGYQSVNNWYEHDIKDSEKNNILKLINEFIDNIKENNTINPLALQFNEFSDHLNMLQTIRKYIPDIEMKAATLKDFHSEHIDFSSLQRTIGKGYSVKYIFDDKLINAIESPIIAGDKTYYPVLLKIDDEYTEEGEHMHHCVASYSDKDSSIIISIREDSPKGSERITCEFNTKDRKLIQSRYFCNAEPPSRFEEPLNKILHKVHFFKGSIKSIKKEHIPLVINGVQINIEKRDNNFLEFFGNDILPI